MNFETIERGINACSEVLNFPLVLLLLPWLLWAASILALRKVMERYVTGAAFCLAASIFIYIYALGLSWVMKDGLAPGLIVSHEAEALKRFFPLAIVSVLITTPTSAIFVFLYLKGRKQND